MKKGTPTMGGIVIIAAILSTTLLWANLGNRYVWVAMLATLGFGLLGVWDDLTKLRTRKGLSMRLKFGMQVVLTGALLQIVFWQPPSAWLPVLAIPFFKGWLINLGWLWIPFAMLVVIGASNAVNLTDGLDGLAVGPVIMAGGAFGVIAYLTGNFRAADYLKILNVKGAGELTVFCGALIGAAIGFLWFNCHPAEVFMGDAGSLALGGAIGTLAVLTKAELLLPLIGGAGLAALVTTERVMITERDEVDMVTRGRAYTDSLAGRRVTVVGLARSGVAAARLLRAAGAQVTGTDLKPLEALGREATALEALGVRLVTGQATRGAFDGADLVVVSPGVPLDGDQLAPARAHRARIFANQTPADCAVLNADDEATAALARRTRAHVVWFSRRRSLSHGVFVRDGRIAAQLDGHVEEICPVAEIFLRGAHNVENVLAATACVLWVGLAPETIRRAIGRFRGVAHRIEFVRDRRGVQYFNDSKGTNVASTLKALESFSERVLLIAGGRGKGQDFEPLAAAARGRVGHAFLIGEDAPKLAAAFKAASIPVTRCPSLEGAVDAARRLAIPGDVVLLSPACASFDMFENFEHRGDVFKKLVERLD